jgi:hypothetical protein
VAEKMSVVADLDEDYMVRMEDVLAIYEQPYDPQEPMVRLDEKAVTLDADIRPTFPTQSPTDPVWAT